MPGNIVEPRHINPIVESMKMETARHLTNAVTQYRAAQKRKSDPDAEPTELIDRVVAKSADFIPSEAGEDLSEALVSAEAEAVEEETVQAEPAMAKPLQSAPKPQNPFGKLSGAELRRAFIMSEILGKPKGRR